MEGWGGGGEESSWSAANSKSLDGIQGSTYTGWLQTIYVLNLKNEKPLITSLRRKRFRASEHFARTHWPGTLATQASV